MLKREDLTRLVQKAQNMDPDAMNALFEECRDPIYYFALKTVQNADLAEDITQEAMIDIFRNLEKLKDPTAFQAWSREITYRQCLHHIKKTPETVVSEDEDGHSIFDTLEEENAAFIPDAAMENEDFRKTVHAMINELPAEQRAALLLFHFDDLSIKEIAQIQGVSENTVKSRLNYARKAVKSSVETYEKKNGIKLRSFAVAPFLAWLLVAEASAATLPAAAAATAAAGITTATGVTLSAASGTSGAVGAGTAAAAATKAAVPLAVKITAGVAAAGIVAGGVAVGTGLFEKEEEKEKVIKPRYESLHMEIYAQSDRYQAAFDSILGDEYADYILTEDNEAYQVLEPEVNVLEGCNVKEVYYADTDLCYVDEDGVTHVFYNGKDYPLPDMLGQVVCHRDNGLSNDRLVITLHEGRLLRTYYLPTTGEITGLNTEYSITDDPSLSENIESVRFRTIYFILDYDTLLFVDGKDAQTFGNLSLGYSPKYSPVLPDGTEVTVERCLSMPTDPFNESPLVTIAGDDRHIYYCSTLSYGLDTCLELPDKRTTKELKQAFFGTQILLLFEDGTVYQQDGEEFVIIEKLSEIGEGGHIKRLYYSPTDKTRLLVLMDDDVLYQFIENPEPIDENIEALLGTYEGSYNATQGETGLTLTVFRGDGMYKAKFQFYNLPGKDNVNPGSYYMTIRYDEDAQMYDLLGDEWIVQPGLLYSYVQLYGTLDGKTFSGEDPTEFSVKRISK